MLTIIRKIIFYLTNKTEVDKSTPEREAKLNELQDLIRYQFKNRVLLKTALTHDSYLKKFDTDNLIISPNERMEFLGDSVLGLLVAEFLFGHFPEKTEGDLSKFKSNIVSEKFLATKAFQIQLGDYIQMSEEERRNGGKERKSILADVMEALICAIYLDGGLSKARHFIHNQIICGFEKEIIAIDMVNYKSILQEYTQGKYQCTPQYLMINEKGPDHQKIFTMEVFINNEKFGEGQGSNKKEAQQRAAYNACCKLKLC